VVVGTVGVVDVAAAAAACEAGRKKFPMQSMAAACHSSSASEGVSCAELGTAVETDPNEGGGKCWVLLLATSGTDVYADTETGALDTKASKWRSKAILREGSRRTGDECTCLMMSCAKPRSTSAVITVSAMHCCWPLSSVSLLKASPLSALELELDLLFPFSTFPFFIAVADAT
jgi:hypothetical protein